MPGLQMHKSAKLVGALLDHVEMRPDELIDRMNTRPALRRLIWEAARAAADTELDAKISALAIVAGRGVVDDAEVEPSRYVVRSLASLEPLHVNALILLRPRKPSGDPLQEDEGSVDLRHAMGLPAPLVEAVASELVRLTVAESVGASFRGIYTELYLSPYGEEVLGYLREVDVQGKER